MRKALFCLLLSLGHIFGFGQLLYEGFEGTTFPPTGWTTFVGLNGLGNNAAENWMSSTTNTPHGGTKHAYVRFSSAAAAMSEDWMVTPAIDLSNRENTQMTFWTKQQYTAVYNNIYSIRVSTTSQTNHASFTEVISWNETTLGTAGVYEQKTVDLSAYDGEATVYVAFVMSNNDGDNWFVDDIEVTGDESSSTAGCLVAPYGQHPSGSGYVPACLGTVENITTNAWTGEYSLVHVTAGTEYTFASSITTDYLTIGNADGTEVLASGLSTVTWTADTDQVIRFYLHLSESCNSINSGLRTKTVQCGTVPPPPVNDDCDNAIALSCGAAETGSTTYATNSGGNTAGDVFFTYTGTGVEEEVTVSLCGSSYDTFVRVFSDCTLSNEIASNDDSETCGALSTRSEVTFTSDGTSTYIIMVEGYNANAGDFSLSVSCEATALEGCLEAENGQYPNSVFEPECIGIPEVITSWAWTGEYSMVQVSAGIEYVFSSSESTDFVTIGNEDGTIVLASGTTPITWTAPSDQMVRFYLHFDADCNWADSGLRSRIIQCGEQLPPPANDDCANAIALSCGDSESGSTIFATDSGANESGDVFYTFTGSGTEELITVSLCASEYDTTVRIYSDCTLSNEVASNDDSCGLQSEVSFVSDGTSTYVIMVEGYGTNVGNYVIDLTCEEIVEPTEYCEPSLDCTDGDLITNVTFANLDNDSDCSPDGYGDYTDQIANVEAGNTYSMSVTVGSGWIYESVMVWIDFNNNYVFEPSEYYFIGSDPGTTNVGDIAIPAGTPDGQYRMRVRAGAVNPDLNDLSVMACDEDTVYGEVEDYTLNVGELGVSDMSSFDFTYYPNPVKDVLNISAKKSIDNVSVYNMAGQQVMSKVSVSNGQVDVTSLTPGVYVFRVTLEGGQIETFKIIKK